MKTLCSFTDFAADQLARFNKTTELLSQSSVCWRPGNEYQALHAYYAHHAMGNRADQNEY